MKNYAIATVLAAGLAIGSVAGVYAKLPAGPAMTDAEKAAAAAKKAAGAAKTAEANARAVDKAVANYRKTKGMTAPMATPAAMSPAGAAGTMKK